MQNVEISKCCLDSEFGKNNVVKTVSFLYKNIVMQKDIKKSGNKSFTCGRLHLY